MDDGRVLAGTALLTVLGLGAAAEWWRPGVTTGVVPIAPDVLSTRRARLDRIASTIAPIGRNAVALDAWSR